MNIVLPRRRSRRSFFYILLLPALAVCICLQVLISTLLPQGFLAALTSLYRAPGYASYPFNNSYRVTMFTSPGELYASIVPNSFVLRTDNGATVQKVPERLFAAYNDILFTTASIPDPQGGLTLVKAIRRSDRKELWSYSFESLNDIQLIDGLLYLNKAETWQQQGLLQALDPVTGQLRWQYSCSSSDCFVGSPQVLNSIAFVRVQYSANNTLIALRASNGFPLWQVSTYTYALQPLLATNRLVLQTSNDTFTAYRPLDGRILWQIHVAPDGISYALRTTTNGTIVLAIEARTLYAFRIDNGALLWQRQDSPIDLNLSKTTLYLAEPSGLLALNPVTGQQIWQQAYPMWASEIAKMRNAGQGVIIQGEYNGTIYVLSKGFNTGFTTEDLFALHTVNGHMIWQHHLTLPTSSQIPVQPGGQSIFAGSDMEVFFDSNTIYYTSYQVFSTVYPVHFTISLDTALSSFFNTTTFIFTAQALDVQSGNVMWQNQQVEQYRVA